MASMALAMIATALYLLSTPAAAVNQEPKAAPLALDLQDVRIRGALDKISTVTGETHTSQGMTSDLGVSVFVHKADPAKVRASLKDLLHLHWSERTKADKTTYVLWQDDRGHLEQERLLREWRGHWRPTEFVPAFIEAYDNAAQLDQEGLDKLRKENPYLYYLLTSRMGSSLRALFGNLGAGVFDTMGPDGSLEIPMSSLNVQTEHAAMAFLRGAEEDDGFTALYLQPIVGAISPTDRGIAIQGPLAWESPTDEPAPRVLAGIGVAGTASGEKIQANDGISFQASQGTRLTVYSPIYDPTTPEAQCIGRVLLKIRDGELKPEEYDDALQREYAAAGLTKSGREVDRDIPEVLKRSAKITLPPDSPNRRSAILRAVAQASDMDVYADSFPDEEFGDVSIFAGDRPLYETLDMLAKDFHCEWEYKDGAVLVHDREWFIKRDWVIPARWISQWQTRLGSRKSLPLNDACRIATQLSDVQAAHGLDETPDLLAALPLDFEESALSYRMYGVLTDLQRTRAERNGLPLTDLARDQLRTYKAALPRYAVGAQEIPILWLTVARADGAVTWVLHSLDGRTRATAALTPASPN